MTIIMKNSKDLQRRRDEKLLKTASALYAIAMLIGALVLVLSSCTAIQVVDVTPTYPPPEETKSAMTGSDAMICVVMADDGSGSGSLNLRTIPSADSAVVTSVPKRSEFSAEWSVDGWVRVMSGEFAGSYANGDYLACTEPQEAEFDVFTMYTTEYTVCVETAVLHGAPHGIYTYGGLPRGTVVIPRDFADGYAMVDRGKWIKISDMCRK